MRRRSIIVILTSLLAAAPLVQAATGGQDIDEYQVKAAFLYNFAKFATWPDGTFKTESEPLRFCVFGDDPVGDHLKALEAEYIQGRPLAVSVSSSLARTKACHVVFVSNSAEDRTALLAAVANHPILTVTEVEGASTGAGVINFRREPAGTSNGSNEVSFRIRFEIDEDAAAAAGLVLSARLLELAVVVRSDGR